MLSFLFGEIYRPLITTTKNNKKNVFKKSYLIYLLFYYV